MIPFVQTKQGVVAYLSSGPKTISRDAFRYEEALSLLRNGETTEQEFLESVDIETVFNDIIVRINEDLFFDPMTNSVEYKGESLHPVLSKRLIEMWMSKGTDGILYLVRFLENLYENPSYRAVQELYGFLDACDLPITEDGHFLAYKRVDENYMSMHANPDGTRVDNHIGQKPSMPRNKVDEDSNRTCSRGLHVCSFEYLAAFGGAHTMCVKVNPRDVVAVPKDYNNAKMRVCLYEVVGEIPDGDRIGKWAARSDEFIDDDENDDEGDSELLWESVKEEFENALDEDHVQVERNYGDVLSYRDKMSIVENVAEDHNIYFNEEDYEKVFDSPFAPADFSVDNVTNFLKKYQ